VLAGQGPAPAGATREHYRDVEGLDLVPGSGALAAAVPGAVDAWLMLLRDHGTWTVADVLAPAIGYARDGHPILERVCHTIAGVAELFHDHWPTSAAQWTPGGVPPEPGSLHRNPEYADVLDRLAAAARAEADAGAGHAAQVDAARHAWRAVVGPAVEEFVAAPHRHSDGRDHAGVMTARDVAGFAAGYEDPAVVRFRGYTVAKTAAWGQGPALLQALAILDGLPDERLDPGSEAGAHTVLETLKLALADRDTWYGDAGGAADADVLDHLLSAEYAAGRRALLADTASHEVRPGAVPGRGSEGALTPVEGVLIGSLASHRCDLSKHPFGHEDAPKVRLAGEEQLAHDRLERHALLEQQALGLPLLEEEDARPVGHILQITELDGRQR
jgi:gamma-glutamyltranspeptidase / glutathione hydrolase